VRQNDVMVRVAHGATLQWTLTV